MIVNEDDPLSRQVGAYYQAARRLPPGNVIRLRFAPGRPALSRSEFESLRREILARTPAHIQAYAVAWTQPYRAGCMSFTSALAFGYDESYCTSRCGPTAPSRYFRHPGAYPWQELRLRPAMLLAARDFADAKALIDRGVAADSSFPRGRAYLLSTPDPARNVRARYFARTARDFAAIFPVAHLEAAAIADRRDVMFYFTGLPMVPQLETIGFLPGALADHVTSFGGQLTDSSQMSALRWLQAGATASYGTVLEPCGHARKFPLPAVAMAYYLAGATALEAYWKSVAWPGEGVFVGEPLARPFAPRWQWIGAGLVEIEFQALARGKLSMEWSASPMGPFRRLDWRRPVQPGYNRFRLKPPVGEGFIRLRW